jgi:2-C-methyl-D-erythritol 2,4-cyclodiphosphate synthase
MSMRIGHGFDVHAFEEGRRLMLGGVHIPYAYGLAGHSDADVLVHAVCDALLGAAGLGDIGRHFPDSDMRYKDADSLELLREVGSLCAQQGWCVNNIDVTVMAEAPKLADYVEAMCARLAATLGIEATQVNIKATTTEGLGFVGRREGIAAMAVVLLVADD